MSAEVALQHGGTNVSSRRNKGLIVTHVEAHDEHFQFEPDS